MVLSGKGEGSRVGSGAVGGGGGDGGTTTTSVAHHSELGMGTGKSRTV